LDATQVDLDLGGLRSDRRRRRRRRRRRNFLHGGRCTTKAVGQADSDETVGEAGLALEAIRVRQRGVERVVVAVITRSDFGAVRGELFLKSALLMPYSKSTAKFGFTQKPTPMPPKPDALVVRALSGTTTPRRGATYQDPKSCACAVPIPPRARAITANKVLRFIRSLLLLWFSFGRPLNPVAARNSSNPLHTIYGCVLRVNKTLSSGNASLTSLAKVC